MIRTGVPLSVQFSILCNVLKQAKSIEMNKYAHFNVKLYLYTRRGADPDPIQWIPLFYYWLRADVQISVSCEMLRNSAKQAK